MFAKGFFPYKVISTSFSTLQDLPPLPVVPPVTGQEGSEPRTLDRDRTQDQEPLLKSDSIKPRFGKVVLMLVDALRSDFLYGNDSDFRFMQSLINDHKAIPFTALASAPTVTLPRLKALTTGTVPGFLDAILNIAESDQSSTLANQDNWLAQLARSPSQRRNARTNVKNETQYRQIGFFGDDTWIKLFPGLFARSEGTSSFFAMDTVEVDNNVTRHVAPELARDDWDGLIFHYLGLDHVGHSGGPKSPLMKPKQAEMDSVAERIYKSLIEKDAASVSEDDSAPELPTLFILCGDHGMNEVGNHGGSSRSEISTSFLFLSPQFENEQARKAIQARVDLFRDAGNREEYQYYKSVSQVDLVPTLSLLLGLPIPKNSVGKLIPDLFLDLTEMETLRALQINAYQVAGVLRNMWSDFETETAVLLEDYKDPDLETTQDEQDIVDSGPQRCSNAKSEKQRLACWYTLALAGHASFLEMGDTKGSHISIVYQEHDRRLQFLAAQQAYSLFLSESSSMLSTALSKYDMPLLANGSLLMAFAVAGLIYCAMQTTLLSDVKASCLEPDTRHQADHARKSAVPLKSMTHFISAAFSTKGTKEQSTKQKRRKHKNDVNWIMARGLSLLIMALYLVTLFASSFVEEEHQFWYFFGMTWWFVLGATSMRYLAESQSNAGMARLQDHQPRLSSKASGAAACCFLQMAILRLLRSWNQTGQKYADQIDLRFYLNSSWTGLSWILFCSTVTMVAAFMIALVFSLSSVFSPPAANPNQSRSQLKAPAVSGAAGAPNSAAVPINPPPVWKTALVSVLQAILTVLIILVSLWITVYKMDLESAFFGDSFMGRVHTLMSTLSSVGYSTASLNEEVQDAGLTLSGYEMARGCYAGLGGIAVLTVVLQVISFKSQASVAKTTTPSKRGRALFNPLMLLGTATLLLILLSRRHNAPIFALFGIQLYTYLCWIKSVRQSGVAVPNETEGQDNAVEFAADDEKLSENAAPSESSRILGTTLLETTATLRTIPGLSSIHSCTVVLCTISSFFLFGNSNSIASIDISNAYVGIQAYDILLTGVLTFVSNWAGPIWWALAAVAIMSWDLEWEIAWAMQDKAKSLCREEEKSWETVHGWKRECKGTLTRKTRRRIHLYKAALARREDQHVDGHGPEAEDSNENNTMAPQTKLGDMNTQPDHEECGAGEPQPIAHHDGLPLDQDASYVYHDDAQETLLVEEQQSPMPCAIKDPQGFRRQLVQERVLDHLIVTSLFFGISLYALSIAAIVLRHHLFIWTVFSPKVLYQFAWTALFQIVVQVLGIGAGVWSIVAAAA
ncbi:major facilitator super transporter protein [Mortierella alpina]|uniref:GPI ethanolamine phosphate transferase 2 n=1 Tax=Mortierella alpina TaxID=64518 RepID=A0A9P6J046_MORAP|nr:major facilitator super transporter protein [Mortierella alpina]